MSNIVLELEEKISAVKTQTARQTNVGTVREIGDGIARVEGLSAVKLNEMIEFPDGVMGLALNLEETEVGVIILGDYTQISEGAEVKTTGKLLSVPVGKALLGGPDHLDRVAAGKFDAWRINGLISHHRLLQTQLNRPRKNSFPTFRPNEKPLRHQATRWPWPLWMPPSHS